MTNTCSVPTCKSGYKNQKTRYSLFRVPQNLTRYKQWASAVPGGALKQTNYVCEKHFQEKYIIRLWQKRDADGRVVAQAPFKRPKLDKFAVPTLFNDSEVIQESAASAVDRGTLKFRQVPAVSIVGLSSVDGINTSGSICNEAQQYIEPVNMLIQQLAIETNIMSPPELLQHDLVPQQELIHEEIVSFNEFVIPLPVEVDSTVPSIQDRAAVHSASIVPERNFKLSSFPYLMIL